MIVFITLVGLLWKEMNDVNDVLYIKALQEPYTNITSYVKKGDNGTVWGLSNNEWKQGCALVQHFSKYTVFTGV